MEWNSPGQNDTLLFFVKMLRAVTCTERNGADLISVVIRASETMLGLLKLHHKAAPGAFKPSRNILKSLTNPIDEKFVEVAVEVRCSTFPTFATMV